MASSNSLLKIFNALFPFSDFFYILQQEEYSSARFLKWLPRFFFRRNFQARETLKLTKRVKSSLAFTVAFWLGSFIAIGSHYSFRFSLALIFFAVAWLFAIPLFVLAGNWLLTPYYNYLKKGIMRRAAATVERQQDLKIVAVAGSFGKTTVKNFVYQFVRYNYATQMIPGNINTPLGIAMWVNAYLKPGTQLLIAEMDAYQRGEIAQSAAIVPADIAIITNVGDQHLERFGSKAALAAALREIFEGAKPRARLLCTSETVAAIGGTGKWDDGRELVTVSDDVLKAFSPEVKSNFSASNQINLSFAVRAAQLLEVFAGFIIDTCGKMELPDRRQKETEWHGYSAIDDSYNISLTTAKAGIAAAVALAKREGKKLLVVTAGIPELGPSEKDGNKKLGAMIAASADHVVVLKSMFADEIVGGAGAKKSTSLKDLSAFLAGVQAQFPPDQWVILVQPELTDLYY